MNATANATAAAKTDKGRLSDHNEDYFVVRRDLSLHLVADGVGGAEAGEVASHVACQLVEKAVRDALSANPPPSRHSTILGGAIRTANAGLFDYGQREAKKGGIGTTLVALWLHGDRALFAYVGDSRIYLYRDGRLRQLSRDETAKRYRLAASLGTERPPEPHLGMLRLRPGDRFLLCTDGLHGSVVPEDLTFILDSQREPAECCERLILRANECGGSDNITALVADVAQPGPREAWRFDGIWFEATSPLARWLRPTLLWLSLLLTAAALVLLALWLAAYAGWWHAPGRPGKRSGTAAPGSHVPALADALAREANAKAAAGDTPAASAALAGAVRALIEARAAISPANLCLDPAAEMLFSPAAETVWEDLYAPARAKLDALARTPAEHYVRDALRATR